MILIMIILVIVIISEKIYRLTKGVIMAVLHTDANISLIYQSADVIISADITPLKNLRK